MASVCIENVYKSYDHKNMVINNVSLDIKDSEFIVFVGPSGCGKSTMLRMIAGLEDISSGNIRIGDRIVNNLEPKDRNIAMVFQNYALYPHMSVAKNMAFGLKAAGVPKEERMRKVRDVAEMLGLSDYLDRTPSQLSGGQRQRVAMGRAIVRNPDVFLFDEPLSNLDAKLRTHVRLEIQKLHEDIQTTTIYVTHDQIEAMTLAHRVVIFNEGIIQQVGTPQEVYLNPSNLFVAGFIGNPPMNFFPATIQACSENAYSASLEGASFDISLSRQWADRVNDQQKVIIGLRPEDIHIHSCKKEDLEIAENQQIFSRPVLYVESMGSEAMVWVSLDKDNLDPEKHNAACRYLGRDFLHTETEVSAVINLDYIHIFDQESGCRL